MKSPILMSILMLNKAYRYDTATYGNVMLLAI